MCSVGHNESCEKQDEGCFGVGRGICCSPLLESKHWEVQNISFLPKNEYRVSINLLAFDVIG